MKEFLLQFFTWWNGETLGTRFQIWRKGEFVGSDEFGNRYYRMRGSNRRWVAYNGAAEPSTIPPGWHGWMHGRTDEPPGDYQPREWQKPHQPNLTGTPRRIGRRDPSLGRPRTPGEPDYEAWQP